MIFEEVSLHNFGAYKGSHSISLEVSRDRPVVAIGALNGSGKTTLLDAMQLALYGKNARCSGRERVSYPDYLASMINRDAPPHQGSGVAFTFRTRVNGIDSRLRVSRTWRKQGETVKEFLEVFRDGILDSVASDRWSEFVEDFMPSQISDLFFFDGEKIEALADPQRSAALLRAGVHSLLGIDLVESLSKSLGQLERKRKAAFASEADQATLARLESEEAALSVAIAENRDKQASLVTEIQVQDNVRNTIVDEFKKCGGDLYERQSELANFKSQQVKLIAQLEDALREVAAGVLPLAIPAEILGQAVLLAKKLDSSDGLQRFSFQLIERDKKLIDFLRQLELAESHVEKVSNFLCKELAPPQTSDQKSVPLSPSIAIQYREDDVAAAVQLALKLLGELNDGREHLDAVERNLAAVPAREDIERVQAKLNSCDKERALLAAKLELMKEELSVLQNKLLRSQQQLIRERQSLGSALMEDEISRRVVTHSERARKTLALFRERLLEENLHRLEGTILDCFKRLIRKGTLVQAVQIDLKSFQISVIHSSGALVPAHRLSAGERQLLAVATLWALAHASGRALPAVIDTPLSRLDSKHRGTLVRNYFPMASHQVILLSTDEEVVGRYKRMLEPFIGREYLIDHDETLGTSMFKQGYFAEEQQEVVA